MSRSVLVVDDEDDICFALSLHLKRRGFRVLTAGNGAEALAVVARLGLPDVVLVDMIMPVMDGWQFARIFHERYPGHGPIVIMTAAADAEKRAHDVGAAGYLEKPFLLADVDATIERMLAMQAR
jgi:urea transport system substrate-binding protein